MNKHQCSERLMEKMWGITVVLACLIAMSLAGYAGAAHGTTPSATQGDQTMLTHSR